MSIYYALALGTLIIEWVDYRFVIEGSNFPIPLYCMYFIYSLLINVYSSRQWWILWGVNKVSLLCEEFSVKYFSSRCPPPKKKNYNRFQCKNEINLDWLDLVPFIHIVVNPLVVLHFVTNISSTWKNFKNYKHFIHFKALSCSLFTPFDFKGFLQIFLNVHVLSLH